MVNKLFDKKSIRLSSGDTLLISKATIEDAVPIIDYLNMVGGESDFLTFGANGFPLNYEQEREIIADCLTSNLPKELEGRQGAVNSLARNEVSTKKSQHPDRTPTPRSIVRSAFRNKLKRINNFNQSN